MVENGQERSGMIIKQSGTVRNGQEHIETFESERSNALERIVENGHGTVTLTYQKRKNYCMLNAVQIN
jgi:mRNA degradation ribonuclease J1/J2